MAQSISNINTLENGNIIYRVLGMLANQVMTDELTIFKYHELLNYACVCRLWMDVLKHPLSQTIIVQSRIKPDERATEEACQKYQWASNIPFITSSGMCSNAKAMYVVGVKLTMLFYFHETLQNQGFDGGQWTSVERIAFTGSFYYRLYDREYSYEDAVCDYIMDRMPNIAKADILIDQPIRFVYRLHGELNKRIANSQ